MARKTGSASVDGNDPWRNVPYINRNGAKVKLNVNWDDNSNRNYAAPDLEGLLDTKEAG